MIDKGRPRLDMQGEEERAMGSPSHADKSQHQPKCQHQCLCEPTLQLAAVAVAASHTAPVEQARACTRVTLPLAHTGCVVAKDMGMVNRTRVEVPSPHLASLRVVGW